MSEQNRTFQLDLHGRMITVSEPTSGQLESMIRIATALRTDDSTPSDFWINQIRRLGTLMDSLIAEADHEYVDNLYLTGKISSSELLRAVLDHSQAAKPTKKTAPKTGPVARVRRK